MSEAVELKGVAIPVSVSLLDLTTGIADAIPKLNSIIGSVAGLTAELSVLEGVASTVKQVFESFSKVKLPEVKVPKVSAAEIGLPKEAGRQMFDFGGDFVETVDKIPKAATALTEAEKATKKANNNIAARVAAMEQEVEYAELTTREIQMQEAIQAGADQEHLDMLDRVLEQEERITNQRNIQAQLIAVGAAATAAATSWLWAYSDMEGALNSFTAKVDDSTNAQRADLMKYAQDIGTAYGRSSAEIVNAATVVADYAYGVEGAANLIARGKTIIAATMDYVAASGKETSAAIAQLSRIINTLGLASTNTEEVADNMVRIGDKISQMAQMAAGDVDQFADALTKKSLIAMRTYGASLDELGAALGTLASAGFVDGSAAGNKMAQMFDSLQKSMLKNRSTWESLLQVMDKTTGQLSQFSTIDKATGGFAKLDDVVQALALSWKDMDEAERYSHAQLLGFNRASYETMQVLVLNQQMLTEYTKSMNEADGVAGRITVIMQRGFVPALTRLQKALSNVGESLGRYLAIPVAYATDALTAIVAMFNKIPVPIKVIIAVGTGLVGVLITSTVAVYGAVVAGKSLIKMYMQAGTWIAKNTKDLWANTAAVFANNTAKKAGSTQQMFDFDGAGGKATGGIFATLKKGAASAFSGIKKAALAVAPFIISMFKPQAILGFLKAAGRLAVTFGKFAAIGTGVGAIIMGVVQGVMMLWKYLAAANKAIADANDDVGVLGSIWQYAVDLAKTLWDVIKQVGAAIYEALMVPFEEVMDAIFGTVEGGDFLIVALLTVQNIFWGITEALKWIIKAVGVALVGAFKIIAGIIKVLLVPLTAQFKGMVKVFNIIKAYVMDVYNLLTGNWDDVGKNLKAAFSDAFNFATETFKALGNKLKFWKWFDKKQKMEVEPALPDNPPELGVSVKVQLDYDTIMAAKEAIMDQFDKFHIEIASVGFGSSGAAQAYQQTNDILASYASGIKELDQLLAMEQAKLVAAKTANNTAAIKAAEEAIKTAKEHREEIIKTEASARETRGRAIQEAKLRTILENGVTDAIDGQIEAMKKAFTEQRKAEQIAAGGKANMAQIADEAERYAEGIRTSVALQQEGVHGVRSDEIDTRLMLAKEELKYAGMQTREVEIQKAIRDLGINEAKAAAAAMKAGSEEQIAALAKVTKLEENLTNLQAAQGAEFQLANENRLRDARIELEVANMSTKEAELHRAIQEQGDGAHLDSLRQALDLEQQATLTGRLRDMQIQAQAAAMTAEQAELYKFQMEGATEPMLAQLEAAQRLTKQLQANGDITKQQRDYQDEIAKRTMSAGEQAYYDAIRQGASEANALLMQQMTLEKKAYEIANKYDPTALLGARSRELNEMKEQGLIESEAYRREMENLRAEAAQALEVNVTLTGIDTFTAGSKRFMKELSKMQANTAVEKQLDAQMLKASEAQGVANTAAMASAKNKFMEETSVAGMRGMASTATDSQFESINNQNRALDTDTQLTAIAGALTGLNATMAAFNESNSGVSQAEQQAKEKNMEQAAKMNRPQANSPAATQDDLMNRWYERDGKYQTEVLRLMAANTESSTAARF